MPTFYPSGKPEREPTKWPSREEWAECHRTLYTDEEFHVSQCAADYASSDEIEAAIAEAEALWVDMGRRMRAIGPAISNAEWRRRLQGTASREEREALYDTPECRRLVVRDERSDLSRCIIKTLREGQLPLNPNGIDLERCLPKAAELVRRYRQAWQRELERLKAERAARPVDDAAWAAELRRRAAVERYLAGDRFCVV
jgi:hypothetical protein